MPVPGYNWRLREGLNCLRIERAFRQAFRVAGYSDSHRPTNLLTFVAPRPTETDAPNLHTEDFFRISNFFAEWLAWISL